MKEIYKDSYCIVFDDFLSSRDYKTLWELFQLEPYEYIQSKKWIKVNRILDGNSLFGPVRFSKPLKEAPLSCIYPFCNSLDILFDSVSLLSKNISKIIGREGRDWSYFTARPYIYPKGSGISWHNDHYGYSGAFVYYIHPEWNTQWGGELLIGDQSAYQIKYRQSVNKRNKSFIGNHLDNDLESQQLLHRGIGTYVLPKPNRIVFLKSGIHHMIKKVDEAAGDHSRCSYAGFFVKEEK